MSDTVSRKVHYNVNDVEDYNIFRSNRKSNTFCRIISRHEDFATEPQFLNLCIKLYYRYLSLHSFQQINKAKAKWTLSENWEGWDVRWDRRVPTSSCPIRRLKVRWEVGNIFYHTIWFIAKSVIKYLRICNVITDNEWTSRVSERTAKL